MDFLNVYLLILSFILGVVIGSFLNVLIFRLPIGMSIVKPRSHCFSCETQLKWYDNIPLLSYLILRGKCRYCHQKISPQYFLIELLTGIIYVLIFLRFRISFLTLIMMVVVSCLIVIFMIDLKHYIIPDSMVVTILIMAIFSLFVSHDKWQISLNERLIGVIIVMLFLAFTYLLGRLIKKDLIGLGDIKLLAVMSMLMGVKYLLISIFISALLALIIEIIIKRNRQKVIPFGPYLATGFFVVIMVGQEIVSLYQNLFIK